MHGSGLFLGLGPVSLRSGRRLTWPGLSTEGIANAVVPLLVALFNLLAGGYALAAGREDRSRLGFALGPIGVGLWALAWFLSLFNPSALPTYQSLGSVAGLISVSGFAADTLRTVSERPRGRRRLAFTLMGGVMVGLWFLSPRVDLLSLLSLAMRATSVGLVGFVFGAAWLDRRALKPEVRRFARRTVFALGSAFGFYAVLASLSFWRGRIGVDPLLFVVLSAETLTLLYIVHRRVELHILVSRAATYLFLAVLVGMVTAVALRGLGYSLDLGLFFTVVLIALFAALLFLSAGDLLARGIERVAFPERTRLVRALDVARGEAGALRRRLAEAERLAIAGEMAATVAHEIKNPLSPVRGYAQLLQARLSSVDEEERAFFAKGLGIIQEEADRIDKRIMSLLAATRPDQKINEPLPAFDLHEILLESIAVTEGEPGVREVRRKLDPEAKEVLGHPDELRAAFVNLMKNAAEAMLAEGRGVLEVETLRKGTRVSIEIRDEGPGLAPGDEGRIFQAFYTTKPGGTGLGMIIARSAVEMAGGHIELVARSDRRGAVARVELDVPEARPKEKTG